MGIITRTIKKAINIQYLPNTKKYNTIHKQDPCPHCGSENVSRILYKNVLSTKFDEQRYNSIYQGYDEDIYYVDYERYKNYYNKMNINTHCNDCKYEYYSDTHNIKRETPKTQEELLKEQELEMYERLNQKYGE